MTNREKLIRGITEYGRTIQVDGWQAGEAVIRKYESRIPDFRRWAYALGILLRAEELLAGLAQQ
jgi:hypothetical protein